MPPLFGKRKFTIDEDEHCDFAPTKQVKLTPRSAAPIDTDSAMTDAQHLTNIVPFPTFAAYADSSRLSINTMSTAAPGTSPNYTLSSLPSSASSPSMSYPTFELYPEVEMPMDVDMDARPSHHHTDSTSSTSSNYTPGLLQPSASTALRHGGNCTTVPRLRMSSHAGLNGTRTLWSHCESCGAIEMVKA